MSGKGTFVLGLIGIGLCTAAWESARPAHARSIERTAASQVAGSSADGAASASPAAPPSLKCVQVSSTTWSNCKDAGNFDSACAVAKCGAGYTLTGGGGSCSAGNRTIKGLNPKLSTGEFGIMCEDQGVAPKAQAICCKL